VPDLTHTFFAGVGTINFAANPSILHTRRLPAARETLAPLLFAMGCLLSCFDRDSKREPLLENDALRSALEESAGRVEAQLLSLQRSAARSEPASVPGTRGGAAPRTAPSCNSAGSRRSTGGVLGRDGENVPPQDMFSPLRTIHKLLGTPGSWGQNTHSRGLGAAASPDYYNYNELAAHELTSPGGGMGMMG